MLGQWWCVLRRHTDFHTRSCIASYWSLLFVIIADFRVGVAMGEHALLCQVAGRNQVAARELVKITVLFPPGCTTGQSSSWASAPQEPLGENTVTRTVTQTHPCSTIHWFVPSTYPTRVAKNRSCSALSKIDVAREPPSTPSLSSPPPPFPPPAPFPAPSPLPFPVPAVPAAPAANAAAAA